MAWTSPKTFVASDQLSAAELNTHVRDNLEALNPLDTVAATSWTPTMTGDGGGTTAAANAGRYYRLGPIIWGWAYWLEPDWFNTPSGAQGNIQLALPVASSGVTAAAAGGQVIGTWRVHDSSNTANSESGAVYLSAGQTARFGRPVGNIITNVSPITIATGDTFSVCLFYPVA